MSQDLDAGRLPGWTVLLSLLCFAVPLPFLWVCREAGLSWWIGGPAAVVVAIGGIFLERAIDRKYLQK
ncbi:hypothetical protein [Burkholderia cenocepacia]|uniref:hypothetical protein n=1 Tax=Burkholderia cenocepacia TaxID=95486 RepID=UPI002AB199D8|nr:hypothetical protein [Burkholderia cenocepacia]